MKQLIDVAKATRVVLRSRKCERVEVDGERFYVANGIRLKSVTNLVEEFFPFDQEAIVAKMIERNSALTREQILAEWDAKSELGTAMHKVFDDFFNGPLDTPADAPGVFVNEFNLMKRFLEEKEFFHVDSEVQIYDTAAALAGTFDALFIDSKFNFYLVDWKRSPHVGRNLMKHKLQLLLYSGILYKCYGIKVKQCIVVGFSGDPCERNEFEFPAFIRYKFEIDGTLRVIEMPAGDTLEDLVKRLNGRVPVGYKDFPMTSHLYTLPLRNLPVDIV